MTRCARWIRRLAARHLAARTVERLVDPILADIELEYRDAVHSGDMWRTRWILLRGYSAFCAAMAVHAVHLCGSGLGLDGPARRTMTFCAGAFAAATFALILPPLLNAPWVAQYPELALYLVPQAIPFSIPIAFSSGVALGWSRTTTARSMLRRVALAGTVGALASLATLEWLVPAANQAWRVAMYSRLAEAGYSVPHASRGVNERPLSELAALVRQTSETRAFSTPEYEGISAVLRELFPPGPGPAAAEKLRLALHQRVALCLAPTALGLLAVAVAMAIGPRNLAPAVFAAFVLPYVYGWYGAQATVPPLPAAIAGWLPNLGVAAVAAVLFAVGARRRAVRQLGT